MDLTVKIAHAKKPLRRRRIKYLLIKPENRD
jgi:hypothetical protein